MGEDYNTPKGFTFRTIAFLDYAEKERPDQKDKAIERVKQKGKRWIGHPISGEDAVEKGVKLIYQAIHRKPYPAKKKAELFNCPIHGELCPADCKNLEKSMEIFNNRWKEKLKPSIRIDDIENKDDKIRATSLSRKAKAEKIRLEELEENDKD
jgi:hypothetical protein